MYDRQVFLQLNLLKVSSNICIRCYQYNIYVWLSQPCRSLTLVLSICSSRFCGRKFNGKMIANYINYWPLRLTIQIKLMFTRNICYAWQLGWQLGMLIRAVGASLSPARFNPCPFRTCKLKLVYTHLSSPFNFKIPV